MICLCSWTCRVAYCWSLSLSAVYQMIIATPANSAWDDTRRIVRCASIYTKSSSNAIRISQNLFLRIIKLLTIGEHVVSNHVDRPRPRQERASNMVTRNSKRFVAQWTWEHCHMVRWSLQRRDSRFLSRRRSHIQTSIFAPYFLRAHVMLLKSSNSLSIVFILPHVLCEARRRSEYWGANIAAWLAFYAL